MSESVFDQYVLIDMHGWQMALPQKDVVSVELLSDAICTRKGGRLVWWIKWQNSKVEILALDQQANPIDVEEVEGNVLVLLGHEKNPVMGLACNSLEVISTSKIRQTMPLPTVMSTALNLFNELAVHDEHLVCLSELSKLESYFQQSVMNNE